MKDPINKNIAPTKKAAFNEVLKKIILNIMTKKGYAISKIEAVEAPRVWIAEKIRKLAKTARAEEAMINNIFSLSNENKLFIPEKSKNIKGMQMISVMSAFKNKN